jgi:hypothetical protein
MPRAESNTVAPEKGPRQGPASTTWSDAVLAVIPAEITAAYLAVRALVATIAQSGEGAAQWDPLVMTIVLVLLALVTPWLSSKLHSGNWKRPEIFPAFSFAVWAANIDYQRLLDLLVDNGASSFALMAFTYAIPIALLLWAMLAIPVIKKSVAGAVS